jgi:uncharacterized protein YcbX
MRDQDERAVGTVAALHRYPVKSMLGETPDALAVTARGIAGDRAWAVLDEGTGKVASAKRAKLWRGLLACAGRSLGAAGQAGGTAIEIRLPDGTTHCAGDPALNDLLSALTGRRVRLASVPPEGAELDRAHPEAVLAEGLDADVASDILKLGAAAPPGTFFDYAPIHLMTSTTLDGLSAGLAGEPPIEEIRYRANVLIRSTDGLPGFPENGWVGGTVRIGAAVALRVILQTPRCAVPVLAHGDLPPRPGALRAAVERNRVEIPGFGNQPCAGAYAEVLQEGMIQIGDPVTFTPGLTV